MPLPNGWFLSLFYGFSAGMLGVTGFETAANYIEEQKPGVYVKVLRNMWFSVFIFNPLMSLITFGCLDMDYILANQHVCRPVK